MSFFKKTVQVEYSPLWHRKNSKNKRQKNDVRYLIINNLSYTFIQDLKLLIMINTNNALLINNKCSSKSSSFKFEYINENYGLGTRIIKASTPENLDEIYHHNGKIFSFSSSEFYTKRNTLKLSRKDRRIEKRR